MTPSTKERQALLFNLRVMAVPEAGPSLPMGRMISTIHRVWKDDRAIQFLGASNAGDREDEEDERDEEPKDGVPSSVIYIADMVLRPDGTTTILFHFGDVEGTNPAFLNIRTRTTKVVRREIDETNGYGAHLVIGPPQAGRQLGMHRCVLERMPHLGRSRLVRFLNRLIRDATRKDPDLEFPDPETGNKRRFRPKLSSSMQLSQGLRRDLAQGTLSHVEFSTARTVEQDDELPQIEVQKKLLRVKVKSQARGMDRVREIVNDIKNWGHEKGYEEMQLHFRRAGTDQRLSPRVRTDAADAFDALYSRSEVLDGFSTELDQCHTRIHPQMRSKLEQLLRHPHLWR